jgi:hypothetical protein
MILRHGVWSPFSKIALGYACGQSASGTSITPIWERVISELEVSLPDVPAEQSVPVKRVLDC